MEAGLQMTKIWKRKYYEKLWKKDSKTVREHYQEINNAQLKIAEIQSNCKHAYWRVGMYSRRPGATSPQRLCCSCEMVIPGITVDECYEAWDKFRKYFNDSNLRRSDEEE
jgi:hypothetical protein